MHQPFGEFETIGFVGFAFGGKGGEYFRSSCLNFVQRFLEFAPAENVGISGGASLSDDSNGGGWQLWGFLGQLSLLFFQLGKTGNAFGEFILDQLLVGIRTVRSFGEQSFSYIFRGEGTWLVSSDGQNSEFADDVLGAVGLH